MPARKKTEAEPDAEQGEMKHKDYRLAAIMFTDIYGFSRMMERDEAGTLKIMDEHNRLVISVVRAHGGSVIKTIGDAFLIDFKNTVDALQSALEIQDKLYLRNQANRDMPLLLRIGLHLGDIYFFENDALGEGINIASRLQSIAHPGCICMSQDVYNLVLNKIDFEAERLGRVSLKNISKEINAYEITTPNVEFDPNHGKPRPGYKPGSFAQHEGQKQDGEAEQEAAAEARSREAIKRSILSDIKAQGRRLSVVEVRSKYQGYGPELDAVVADLSAKGILRLGGESPQPQPQSQSQGQSTTAPEAERPRLAPDASFSDRFRAIGNQIVDEVTRGIENELARDRGRGYGLGEGSGYDRHADRMQRREERREERHEQKRAAGEEALAGKVLAADDVSRDGVEKSVSTKWEKRLSTTKFSSVRENSTTDMALYRQQVALAADKSWASFIPNLATWLGVSSLLCFINFKSTGIATPWAVFPVFGWGVGIIEHFFAARRKRSKSLELDKLPDLNPDQLSLFKRINLAKDAFTQHAVSAFSVSAMLASFNAFTMIAWHNNFPWALIVAGILLVSLAAHSVVHFPRLRHLEGSFLKSLGLKGRWGRALGGKGAKIEGDMAGPYRELYLEALGLKDSILEQLKQGKKKNRLGMDRDIGPALDAYVDQIRLLAGRSAEIDRIVDSIPMDALRQDKEELLAKAGQAGTERMRKEYRKSIEEIESQEKSFNDLEDQREMLKLRLKSSVNSLKQMRLDMARLSTMPEMGDSSTVDQLKQKTGELTQYLEDLKAGLAEGESSLDPYEELAEVERQRLKSEGRRLEPEGRPRPHGEPLAPEEQLDADDIPLLANRPMAEEDGEEERT